MRKETNYLVTLRSGTSHKVRAVVEDDSTIYFDAHTFGMSKTQTVATSVKNNLDRWFYEHGEQVETVDDYPEFEIVKNAEGMFKVRVNGQMIPGLILGGKANYVVQIGGKQIETRFYTKQAAADCMVLSNLRQKVA